MSRADFIALIVPGAQEVQRRRGIFASVTIAQAIWETGAGAFIPHDRDTGENSYNIFGRKARPGEPYVTAKTWEVYSYLPASYIDYAVRPDGKFRVSIWDNFKKFNSYEESVLDRTSFLTLPWYKRACTADNPFDAARFLIDTGFPGLSYATDPAYATGLIGVINGSNLTQYDLPKGPILGEDEEEDIVNKVLEYADWAWAELDAWAGAAYNEDYLEDWAWVQNIRDKKLTYSELLLLKVLIDDRRRTGNKVVRTAT